MAELDKYFSGTNAETAYLLGRYCGLRINECYGLKWENVDIERGTITIDRQMQYQEGLIKLVSLKTRNARRTVYMSDKLKAYFSLLLQQQQRDAAELAAQRAQNQTVITDIDGKKISQDIKDELKEKVTALKDTGTEVALAVIQVGNDPASSVYVRNKKKACEYIGIRSLSYELPEETTEDALIELIEKLNKDETVNGILVQLPVPKHIDPDKIIRTISPEKDVDGFHPQNVGKLVIGEEGFVSCTPAGVIQLLKRSGIEISGKNCVVVGRSNIVGKPMALLMLRENATVTIAHSKTKNLKELCQTADILIVAIGKPQFITADYVKEGAVVIDVGIHRDENNKLCGDVRYEEVAEKASAITPVPGGVGPMTIAMLMSNCVESLDRE
ncbi:MAG: bifunctional methylenetetrahydrofolate dehydrogenase/methenyltetrahydrofolate cyclohydrolase FolD [Roseburia inulinivorans]|nr:bifunctional methylenetetrahydrofolate dehydrogenase/methenyltetrahydrofolate cyclohydrolase FolD [Roseburia inulinivorans]